MRAGVMAGGGTPIEFSTIVVTDGTAMGSDGMRASLLSRKTIADSIELTVSVHYLDAMVLLVGCDKTITAAAMTMAAARLDNPTAILYGGTIMSGQCRGKAMTVQDVFEAVGAHHAAGRCGELVMQRLRDGGPTPRDILSPNALRNAARAVSATAGSTNAVLHLLAVAHEAGVIFDLEEFEAAAACTPVIADLKPGGCYTAAEMFAFGGVALVARELRLAGLIEDVVTVTGRSFFNELDDAHACIESTHMYVRALAHDAHQAFHPTSQPVVRPVTDPFLPCRGYDPAWRSRAGRLHRQASRPWPRTL